MKLYEPFEFLTTDECDELINYARGKKATEGKIRSNTIDHNVRKNRVVSYDDPSKWKNWISIINQVDPVIDWIQNPQISFYRANEYYNWHSDQYSSKRTHQRRFTLTCELKSAPGARLQIQGKNKISLKKGEAIIFNSTDTHRATSPISGERISLTIWAMAKNYTKS